MQQITKSITPATILLISILVLFSACKSSQHLEGVKTDVTTVPLEKIEKGLAEMALLHQIVDSTPRCHTFSSNFSANISMADFNQSVSGQIRMVYDSILWISVGKFGIEAIRILVSPDSLYILNKLDQSALIQDLSFVSKYLSGFKGLKHLQNILLGYPIAEIFNSSCDLLIENQNYTFAQNASALFPYRFSMTVDSATSQLEQWEVNNKLNQKASIQYTWLLDKFENILKNIQIETAFPLPVNVELNYTKTAINQTVKMPFTISNKMRRVSIGQLKK
ncbi:MAG: DUF4292 domain-containing protein [Bacteroidales bacterium]